MKKIILLALLISGAHFANAQRYFSKTAHVHFFSHTSAEDIKADNYKSEIVLDKASGAVQFSSLIKSFEFELVISDNSNSDIISDFISKLNDQRIKYTHSKYQLSFIENFNKFLLAKNLNINVLSLGDIESFNKIICKIDWPSEFTRSFADKPLDNI